MLYTMGLTIVADIQIQYSSSESESVFFFCLGYVTACNLQSNQSDQIHGVKSKE